MKNIIKIKVFLIVLSCFLASCGKQEIYSCDPEADLWVKSNLTEVRNMTRADWLAISDDNLRRATFIAFTPDQKRALWVGKMEEVLKLDWTVQEVQHIKYILEFIKVNPVIFANKSDFDDVAVDELDIVLYKWEEYAEEVLGWSGELLHNLVYTAQALNKNREIDSSFCVSARLKRGNEQTPITLTYCSCNAVRDCKGNNPKTQCRDPWDLQTSCTPSDAGCGLFNNKSCKLLCHTPN